MFVSLFLVKIFLFYIYTKSNISLGATFFKNILQQLTKFIKALHFDFKKLFVLS